MSHNHFLYRHYKDGELLYVGVSLNIFNRLNQHKDNSHWFNEITSITIEQCMSRVDALEKERIAITEENPKFNLKRPSVNVRETKPKNDSGNELIKRIVQFNPTYSIDEVGNLLGSGPSAVRKWIEEGVLGYVIVGYTTGRWGKTAKKRITGWQLIDFIEYLENSKNQNTVEGIYEQPGVSGKTRGENPQSHVGGGSPEGRVPGTSAEVSHP